MSATARKLILAPRNTIWDGTASVWEIAIKHGLGRGDMPISCELAIRYFRESGYRFLPIGPEHAAAVESLPLHHRDPFDRLLIAQAQVEPMRLLSHDGQVARYGELVVPV